MLDPMEIRLARNTDAEVQTRDALRRLLEKYDLRSWIYTRTILVDETATSHSHPVLTLNTARTGNERLLLSLFIHEQLHWFEEERAASRDLAIERTRQSHPQVPNALPEGAKNEASTRLHLLVCYLEYQAMRELVGAAEAREAMLELSRHNYRWVYRTVLEDDGTIGCILREYNLLPEPLLVSAMHEKQFPDPGITS
jgi:hypothetical protein